VYIQDCGTLRAFDRVTGVERWHTPADAFYGTDSDRLTLAGNLLYVSNGESTLWILDAGDGTLVRSITLGTTPGSNAGIGPPIVVRGHVVVAGYYALETYSPATVGA